MVQFGSPEVSKKSTNRNMKWSVRHQVILLGALQRYGSENWQEVADFLSKHSWFKKSLPISKEACREAFLELVRSFLGSDTTASKGSFEECFQKLATLLTKVYIDTVKKEVENTRVQLKEVEEKILENKTVEGSVLPEAVLPPNYVEIVEPKVSKIPEPSNFKTEPVSCKDIPVKEGTDLGANIINFKVDLNQTQVSTEPIKSLPELVPQTSITKAEQTLKAPTPLQPGSRFKRNYAQPLQTPPAKKYSNSIAFKRKLPLSQPGQNTEKVSSIGNPPLILPIEPHKNQVIAVPPSQTAETDSEKLPQLSGLLPDPTNAEKEAIAPTATPVVLDTITEKFKPKDSSQDLPKLILKNPPKPLKVPTSSISGRPRRASRGDVKPVTPSKKPRLVKKPNHDPPKVPGNNEVGHLQTEEPILQVDSVVQDPPLISHDKLEPVKVENHENPTEVLTPPTAQNPNSSLISSPLLASDPSDLNAEDLKDSACSSPPLDYAVESDNQGVLDNMDSLAVPPKSRASSHPFIQSSLQECSSGLSTPIKLRSNSTQMAWLDTAQYKTWKKLASMVLKDIAHHRLAPIFQRPIKESLAPGYYSIVKRPMDLSTIQSRIKNGVITTTEEFTRDVLLMCQNALMFNRGDTEIHGMAREMLASCKIHLENLTNAVLYATAQPASAPPFPLP